MPFGDPISRINVCRATRRDCDQIFELVNLAFKPEIGKSGIAYRKCDKYRLKDSARKHLEDMWVVKDGRKVCFNLFVIKENETANSPIHEFKVLQNVFKMKKQGLKCSFFKVINKK